MTWLRHDGDSKFHTGVAHDASFCTFCDGRWPLTDTAVEPHENPPSEDRCRICELVAQRNFWLAKGNDILVECERLRAERDETRARLEAKETELNAVERELAELQGAGESSTALANALVEAIEIARAASRRGGLSMSQSLRLRELERQVPQ